MAEIKMDISEYELLKENKGLLEESLLRERELSEQITKLNQEKIAALEEAKMKVVKITTTRKEEHALQKRNSDDVIRDLRMLFSENDLRHKAMYSGYAPNSEGIVAYVESIFFKKVTSYSDGITQVTTHGLEEIRDEIRKELKENLSIEIQSKIAGAEETYHANTELAKRVQELQIEIGTTVQVKNLAMEKNDELTKQVEDLRKTVEAKTYAADAIEYLGKLIKQDQWSYWNRGRLLGLIKGSINKYFEIKKDGK